MGNYKSGPERNRSFQLGQEKGEGLGESHPSLGMMAIRFLTHLPLRFHLLISEPSLLSQDDSVQHYWVSLHQNTWTCCRVNVRSRWNRWDQAKVREVSWEAACLCLCLKLLPALVKILALIWVNVAWKSTFPWPNGISFRFTACTESMVPPQWAKPQWP